MTARVAGSVGGGSTPVSRRLEQLRRETHRDHAGTSTRSSYRRAGRKETVMPGQLLWQAIEARWPGRAVAEYPGAVPGRHFRIDVAFVNERLAIEIDGFSHHGKFLSDFKKHHHRQNLISCHLWYFLRFPAGKVRTDLEGCLGMIETMLASIHQGAYR